MFITSLYDLYGNPEAMRTYLELFRPLAESGLPFLVFTDPSLLPLWDIMYPNLRLLTNLGIIPLSLSECELYQIGMSYQGDLPTHRHPTKDTKEFFSLMNTKIEFMKKGAALTDDPTLIWLDMGLLKIVTNKEKCLERLRALHASPFDKITIPGCWSHMPACDVNRVNWRFCGGLLILPRRFLPSFYDHSKNVLTDFCTLPIYKLTWETNVWSVIEYCAEKENIVWYQADHNDSMILAVPLATPVATPLHPAPPSGLPSPSNIPLHIPPINP
jgi:hypothetical protein